MPFAHKTPVSGEAAPCPKTFRPALLGMATLAAIIVAAPAAHAQLPQAFGGLYTTSFVTPTQDTTRPGVIDGGATFTITPNLPTPYLFSVGTATLFTTPAASSPVGTIVYNETTGGVLTATAPGRSGAARATLNTDGVLTYIAATNMQTYSGTFTFTGGTGDFAGATGSGTITAATVAGPGTLSGTITLAAAPEPSSVAALGLGLLGLSGLLLRARSPRRSA